MTESFPTSKRTDERFPILAHVRFRLISSPDGSPEEPELHNGNNVIWNISRTGLFLATKNYAEIKSIVEVEFPLDDMNATIRSEAEVVRANHLNNPNQGKYEYGLRFTKIDEASKQVLDKFITLIDRKK
jgi:c-di-GMP-binding flagellar brake protein YcgR